jgi:hypothetical protein
MAEVENPPITVDDSKGLFPVRMAGTAPLDRWVEADPEKAVKLVDARVKMLEALRVASIRATYPSDWIITTTTDRDGAVVSQRGYLQDIGAERAGKIWGIEVGNPAIGDERFDDGTIAYHMIAEAWSKVTGERLDYVEGSRWSGDPFFARQVKDAGDRVDPTDVRKAAYANLHGRAVRALGGLNGVPLDVLRQAGLDTNKVVHVNYKAGEKGGDSSGAAAVGSAEAVVAFGNSKGKKVSELEDKDLGWYEKAYAENVADPGRQKFARANQRVLDAIRAEQKRRAQAVAHEAETGTKPEPSTAPSRQPAEGEAGEGKPEEPAAKLRGDVWTRLVDAAGRQAIPLLGQLTKEMFGVEKTKLSEVTDEELRRLAAVPEANLKAVASGLGTAKP